MTPNGFSRWFTVAAALLTLLTPCAQADDAPLPASWLHSPSQALVLRVRQENLQPVCRAEAAELVQSVVNELLRADYTVHFAREFVESELAYYRAHPTNDIPRATAEAVSACLEASLKKGEIDWDGLRAAHLAAPDSGAVTRHLPWLHLPRDRALLRLAGEGAASLPMVELTVRWNVQTVRGISVSTVNVRGVVQSPLTTLYSGSAHLSNIDATLALRRDGLTVVERKYPEEAWKKHYDGPFDTPLYVNSQKILLDVRAGLKPPPPSPDQGKKKKKAPAKSK